MCIILGARPGCREGSSHPVFISGQVLPGGCVRGADTGDHAAPVLPAGQAVDSQHGHLLSSRGLRVVGVIRCPGQGEEIGSVTG